jgi:hypothetical protein
MNNPKSQNSDRFKSHWIDTKERTLDRGYLDIVGLVSPQQVMDDPGAAIDALLTIRRLSAFIDKITAHIDCGGLEWTDGDFRVLGHLAESIYQGAGYIIEYLERDVQPGFREQYAVDHGEKRTIVLEGSKQ